MLQQLRLVRKRVHARFAAALLLALLPALSLAQTVPDTAVLHQALRIADSLEIRDPAAAHKIAKPIAAQAALHKLKHTEALASNILGTIARNTGQTDSAIYYHARAKDLFQEIGNDNQADLADMYIAYSESTKGKHKRALELLLGALSRQEKRGVPMVRGKILNELGKLHDIMGHYTKSEEFLMRARALFTELGDGHNLALNSDHLANLYTGKGDLAKAKTYYLQAKKYREEHNELRLLAGTYANLGNLHLQQKEEATGLAYYHKALALQEKLNNTNGQISILNNLGLYYEATLGQPKRALPYYQKALALAQKTGDLESEQAISGNLYFLYKDRNDPANAILHLERYLNLQDSLMKLQRVREIAELQEKYEADKRARQIAQLRSENQLKEANASRRTLERNVSIAGSVLLLALVVLLVRYFRQKQRSAQELAAKNQELSQQHVQELLRKHEVATLHAHLEGQEGERKRIAHDLHDRLGGLLATVKLYFQVARTPEQVKKTTELLDAACQEVRQIAHDMVSGVLLKFGLVAALRSLAESITASGRLTMETNFFGLDKRLESHVEITLYRVVQELVSNALRHARATEIHLQLTRQPDMLSLLLEDNGLGFNPDKITPGLGLESVTARVQKLGGTVTIDSGLGNGTTIIVEIPQEPVQVHHEADLIESGTDARS